MDEILIGDQKYIASKQAAKITGYAKDYIGQLCREGRVPAQLVGRNWYVLASAIHEHRFGSEEATKAAKEALKEPEEAPQEPIRPVASSKYESIEIEPLPPINKTTPHEAWANWFDQLPQKLPAEAPIIEAPQPIEPEISDEKAVEEVLPEAKIEPETKVLIQKMDLPIENRPALAEPISSEVKITSVRRGRIGLKARIGVGALAVVSIVLLSLTLLNTGYFDGFIISSVQASALTGLRVYQK